MNAEVTIRDLATTRLDALLKQATRPKGMLSVAGRRVSNELRAYFLKRNEEGNKRNWPRSNFWSSVVAAATHFDGATDTEATVTIASREFLHKLEGGTIRAKSGRMLAIPLTAKAKEAGSPREWDKKDLFVLKSKEENRAYLARKKGKSDLELLYLLIASVHQEKDPHALPPEGTLEAAAEDEAAKFLKRSMA